MTRWDPRAVIAAKRDGGTLAPEEIERFVLTYARGELGDGPAAAFLMASLLRGLDEGETLAMTHAMIASGDTVAFGGLGRHTVDKHSTGGVADGVTLVFAPIAAALGLGVAKLSGRGLGHTGGTLDKLESIPGLRTDLSPAEMEAQVREWVRRGRAVAGARPGRRSALRLARRDRHGAVHPADRGERDVQEARGRHGADPARREGRVRRVHAHARGCPDAGAACLALARGAERPAARRA